MTENNKQLRISRRNQLLRTLIILAKDQVNSDSNSCWIKFPKEIRLHILALFSFKAMDSIDKSGQQVFACAKFIIVHIYELCGKLKENYRFKIVEKINKPIENHNERFLF